jgi:hypothetical protein
MRTLQASAVALPFVGLAILVAVLSALLGAPAAP